MERVDPTELEAPPADPDEWTSEQWIDWLIATDADPTSVETPATKAGRLVHSTGGQLLGQTMMGLAGAIYGQRQDPPAIVVQANSDPEEDPPFQLHLDHEHPEDSTATLRRALGE